MRSLVVLFGLPLLFWSCAHALRGPASEASPLEGARQAVVVITDDWAAVPGTLQRFERAAGSPWRPVGEPIRVVVGRTGLGWGIGLHGGPPRGASPVKHEGDGRSPAGVFRIGSAFGYDAPDPAIRLPYIQLTPDWKCVDDSASAHYNEVLDARGVAVNWNSHEEMRRRDDAYRLGAIVEHNWAAQRQRAGGSCIFLHIWGGPGSSTVGCTAMTSDDVRTLLAWLEPASRPALVQLPRQEYGRRRATWHLP